jgi:hypothetical protein
MRVPCQGGCGKTVDLTAADAHKLYIAVRRPNCHEAEIDACSPECTMKAGMELLASLVPNTGDKPITAT